MIEVFLVKPSRINKEFEEDFFLITSKVNITYLDMILKAKERFNCVGGDYVWLGEETSITWLRIRKAFWFRTTLKRSEMEILFKVLNLRLYDY